MAAEHSEKRFEEVLAEPVRNGVYKPKEFHGRGQKIVNMGELFAYPRLKPVPMKRVDLSSSERERFMLAEGDLLFARRSLVAEGAGKCSIVIGLDEPTTFESSIIRARPDRTKADPLYLYYFFNSALGLHCLDTIRRQVAVAGITGRDLSKLEIPLPDLEKQQGIANILGTLDDKIELNRRTSETLEAMAQALFKSWFVDFDPVRAKAEGRAPGLPKEIADLFPDRLVDSELGEIPEGWEVATVGQYMANHDSRRIPVSGSERMKRPGPYPYHGAAGVMDYVDDYLFDGIYLLVGEDGSVMSDSGLGVTQYVWGKLWVNNHAHVLQGKGAVSTEQLYLYFHFETVAPYVTGAVQPKLSQGRMNTMPFVFAGEIICHKFRELVDPWFEKLRICTEVSRTLAALRDAHLPKLLSGELRVDDAAAGVVSA